MTRYRRSPDALSTEIGDDVVALQAARGFAFGMEGVTASVWQLLAAEPSEDEIIAALLEQYEVPEATCRSDVAALLADLETEGLIERVAA
ncbi:PqqD family protein [Sphingomonas astaxanthinifaciens]|uniref:Coenzyme PQQ synthesis protein D (PqqD) n=1 Tax=Sphingomonas astaxanthinifaciens DSM 22298 TaxID=1123267 RepID=A0ABQ5Z4V3_9SPHN|nr:PqqD family protein [Sphingomonas astaxanthinifaciens]GLR47025.1 hypothetical protein GCM10007925_07360 [Sphingomonas astaxanthinifaciens DSM 22298]